MSERLQYVTLTKGLVLKTETKETNHGTKRDYESNGPNRYLQNISPKHKRIYFPLSTS